MSLGLDPDGPDRLAALVAQARRITVLTGAGISTECGVPDFRSPASPWRRYPPMALKDFLASPAMRAEAWRRKFAMDDLYRHAQPGRCHAALVAFAEAGRLEAVVTQNIDGLHTSAGLPPDRLVELHGNGTFARCLDCGTRFELAPVRAHLDRTGEALTCGCGGAVKSASIAFGQKLDPAVLARAVAAAEGCDLFIAIGSSLVVRPAATLPLIAKAAGAVLVVVNRDPTPLDQQADLAIRCDAGDALVAARARLKVHTS
jgi:NAD-dependent deacetylase